MANLPPAPLAPGVAFPRGFSIHNLSWPLVAARELVSLHYGKALVERDRTPGSVPVYGTNGQCGWNGTPLASGPTVVLGRKGMGPLGVEWCENDFWVIDTAYYVRSSRPNLDLKFFYYLVKYMGLNHLKDGTSNPSLSRDTFYSQGLPFPPYQSQRSISSLLSALDQKIELNRRMNETLEAMARALFKSWFVDFDPVRAKAEGRQPWGIDPATASLFPSEFEDSELRPIPKGWAIARLEQLADVVDCLHSKKPDREPEGFPLLQLSNIKDNGLLDLTDTYYISRSDYELWTSRIEAMQGDCVITNVGRVGAVAQVPDGVKAALGRNMTAVRCRVGYSVPTFLLEALTSDAMTEEISRKTDTGTILDALNVRNIGKLRVVVGPASVLERFETIARPLRAKMEANLEESRILAALRDTMLPRLLSGEVRVQEAEHELEGVR